MATIESTPRLSPHVAELLARLRRRIRLYLWARGLALTVAAAGLVFWLLLAIDWFFEPTREVRLGMLVAGGLDLYFDFNLWM